MELNISKQTELDSLNKAYVNSLLNSAVRKVVGVNKDREKYSIVECAKNEYLSDKFDPFKLLEFTLMAYSVRAQYGFGSSSLS